MDDANHWNEKECVRGVRERTEKASSACYQNFHFFDVVIIDDEY